MLNTILSAANAALQYQRGKTTGLAGLAFIALALLVVFQWDHVVPFFEWIGLIGLLDNLGLIYEGESYLTGYAIFGAVFRITIVFVLLLLVGIVLAVLFSMLGSSNIGLAIALGIGFIVMAPFMIIWAIYDHFFTSAEEKKKRDEEAKERRKTPLDLIIEKSREITENEAKALLNRIPTNGDDRFLLGVSSQKDVYLLVPKPTNLEAEFYKADYYGVKYSLEKIVDKKTNLTYKDFEEIKLRRISRSNDYDWYIREVDIQDMNFYISEHDDVLLECYQLSLSNFYRKYLYEVQNEYFVKKEYYNGYLLTASNEDIVRMMKDNQGRYN